jgi:Zn-dependent protease with chaperone function
MSSGHSRARPELDPFAFPSDTTFRFLLLILSVVGTSLFAFNRLYFGIHDSTARLREARLCIERSESAAEARACSDALNHAAGAWTLRALAVLVVVALAVYLVMPRWKLWRRRLEPLTAGDAPEVVARLGELSREAGLETPPRFVWNPLSRSAGGLAFGRVGRRYVALGGGLVTTSYTDPEAFRAVVLHELGHLRNRDVDKTYFTMALWYSFLAVAALPLLLSLYDERLHYVWSIVWRLGALVALVYLSRNAVLRSREVYADVRASQSQGGGGALRRVIGALPGPASRPWRRILSVHPEPAARVAALDDTDRLFRPGLGEAFLAGVVLILNYGQLSLLIHFYDSSLTGPFWLAALAVAPCCAGVVSLGIWRGAFLSLARPGVALGVWRLGLALGVGFLAGEVLSLQTIVTSGDRSLAPAGLPEIQGVVSSAVFGPGIVWVVLAIVSLTLFALWLDAAARVWLSRGGERLPRIAMGVGIVAAGAVLTVWTGLFFLLHDVAIPTVHAETAGVRDFYEQIANAIWSGPFFLFRLLWDGVGLVLGSDWPVIPAFALLWAFPLAAAAKGGHGHWPSWAFLGADRPASPRPERLNVARALVIGLLAGLAAWAGALALRAGIHASVGTEPPLSPEYLFGLRHWQVVLAVAAQPFAAAVAAVFCRRPVLHGLLAGFVAGVVSAAGLLADTTIASCAPPFSLVSASDCPRFADAGEAHFVFDQVLSQGSLLALMAAFLTGGAAWLVRRRATRARAGPQFGNVT